MTTITNAFTSFPDINSIELNHIPSHEVQSTICHPHVLSSSTVSTMLPGDNGNGNDHGNDSDSVGSSSTIGCFDLLPQVAFSPNRLASKVASTSTVQTGMDLKTISVSQPTSPIFSTPVGGSKDSFTPPPPMTKNVHSLDREMRSRKRRRRNISGCVDDYSLLDCPQLITSLNIERISLPPLSTLEDCVHVGEACLPDTSFLARKKSKRLRRGLVI